MLELLRPVLWRSVPRVLASFSHTSPQRVDMIGKVCIYILIIHFGWSGFFRDPPGWGGGWGGVRLRSLLVLQAVLTRTLIGVVSSPLETVFLATARASGTGGTGGHTTDH